MMGVSGLAGDPAYPPEASCRCRRVPLGKLGETLARGFNKLGWHWWPSDSAIITRELRGPRAVHQRWHRASSAARRARRRAPTSPTGPPRCGNGVQLRTALPRARDHRRRERHGATASSTTTPTARAPSRRRDVVVVACNGIGTPRLLLNSKSKHFPDGLANRSGLVGKNLMFHPYAMVTGIFDELSPDSRLEQ